MRNLMRWSPLFGGFLAWEAKKKIPLLFLTALIVYNAGSVLLSSKGITFSGDEPHYTLNAHSLIEDGDLDLADNYKNADYKAYLPDNVLIEPHALAGAKPGSRLSLLPAAATRPARFEAYWIAYTREPETTTRTPPG
jgi:hypothetical protein